MHRKGEGGIFEKDDDSILSSETLLPTLESMVMLITDNLQGREAIHITILSTKSQFVTGAQAKNYTY